MYSRIEGAIREALASDPDRKVIGVGVAAAGVVDPKTGSIAYANEIMPGWSGIELGPRPVSYTHLEVPGVGPTRKKAIMKRFGSMKRLRAASEAEIAEVPGVPAEVARSVFESLRALEAQRVEQDASEGE